MITSQLRAIGGVATWLSGSAHRAPGAGRQADEIT
jgi:hypothetical protein